MTEDFLIQFLASVAAVGAIVALASWARIARPAPPLDEARARRLMAQEFPGRALEALWVASDGRGALARSGSAALVLCQAGDGYAARVLPWAQALAGSFRDGWLRLDLGEVGAPQMVIALPQWPPRELAA